MAGLQSDQIYRDALSLTPQEVDMLKSLINKGPKYPDYSEGKFVLKSFADAEKSILDDIKNKLNSDAVRTFKFFQNAYDIEFDHDLNEHVVSLDPYKVDMMVRTYDLSFRGRFDGPLYVSEPVGLQINFDPPSTHLDFHEIRAKIIGYCPGKIISFDVPAPLANESYSPHFFIRYENDAITKNYLLDSVTKAGIEIVESFELK